MEAAKSSLPKAATRCQYSSCLNRYGSLTSSGYLFELLLELRLKIYEFALPANQKLIELAEIDRLHKDYPQLYFMADTCLLKTCKPIHEESIPVLLSTNSFNVSYSSKRHRWNPRTWFDNVREVAFMWRFDLTFVGGRWNSRILEDLWSYRNLQKISIHIVGDTGDEIYKSFRTGYQQKAVLDTFIEHSCLKVLMAIPGLQKLSFEEYLPRERELGKYMTEQIASLRSTRKLGAKPSRLSL